MRRLSLSLFLALSFSQGAFAAPNRSARLSALMQKSLAQKTAATSGPVAELIVHATKERDPLLQKLAVESLLKMKLPLVRAQKVAILGLVRDPVRGLLPKEPPMPKAGTIEVRHYAMNGFMAADLAVLKQAGFSVTQGPKGTEATRGRMHVLIRETGDDVLRDLSDPNVHMIVYSGHSQLGGTIEQALQGQGAQGPASRKLVALFQCVGTQTLPLLKAQAPMADVITSNSPLYIAEIPSLVKALYTGIDKGENYQRIARRFESVAWKKGRLVSPNQTATLKHVDFDANGELDSDEMQGEVQTLDAADRERAQHLMSGVHFLGTLNPYYADETPGAVYTRAQADARVIAKGLGTGDGKTVTQISDVTNDGKRAFEVRLDQSWKSASPTFIGAAAVYEVQMHLQKAILGKDDRRAQARALAFAGEYLELMPRSQAAAQQALDQLTQMKGLPKISAWAMQNAIAGEHILTEQQIDRVEALLRK